MILSEPEILGSPLDAKMQVTKQCEIWHFATLTLVCLANFNLLCQNNYLLLLLATLVNTGPTTARQATSTARHHGRVWLVSSCTIQKSHIVTRKMGPPFWSDCALLVSCGLKVSDPNRIRIFCLNLTNR